MGALRVDAVGTGPDVLFLHGLPSPAHELVRFAEAVGGIRGIVPTLHGYGETTPAPGEATVEGNAQAIEALLGELGVREVVVVGYSMGAYRALSLALRGNVRVKALALLAGFGGLSPEEQQSRRELATALRAGADLRAAVVPILLSARGQADPEKVNSVKSWLDLAPTSVLVEEIDDLAAAPSLLEGARGLSMPVLVRAGELDATVPIAHSEKLAAALPQSTFQRVPGCGHALLLEDFEATRDAVRSWLQSVLG